MDCHLFTLLMPTDSSAYHRYQAYLIMGESTSFDLIRTHLGHCAMVLNAQPPNPIIIWGPAPYDTLILKGFVLRIQEDFIDGIHRIWEFGKGILDEHLLGGLRFPALDNCIDEGLQDYSIVDELRSRVNDYCLVTANPLLHEARKLLVNRLVTREEEPFAHCVEGKILFDSNLIHNYFYHHTRFIEVRQTCDCMRVAYYPPSRRSWSSFILSEPAALGPRNWWISDTETRRLPSAVFF
jgi:hypothetical protein